MHARACACSVWGEGGSNGLLASTLTFIDACFQSSGPGFDPSLALYCVYSGGNTGLNILYLLL